MKKTRKKIIGLFGLAFVVAMTIFAAILPTPETKATIPPSTTDTISVRVVGEAPNVEVTGIEQDGVVVTPEQTITTTYENIEKLHLDIKYTDADGVQHEETLLDDVPVDYIAGVSDFVIDFTTGEYSYTYEYYVSDTETQTATGTGQLTNYGYGDYVVTASGSGVAGEPDESTLVFSYYPFDMSVVNNDGDVDIDLVYVPDDGTDETEGNVAQIVINIYDENGNPVGPSPIVVPAPGTHVDIDLNEYGLPSGTYTIEAVAYDRNGTMLYKPITRTIIYEAQLIPVPDTCSMMGNLNVSKTDYLITGLIIFGIVGTGGAIFITKHDKKSKAKSRK